MAEVTHAPMPDAEPLAEPLRSRWSPTVFDPAHHLDEAELDTLLQAARWAPSHGNSQPWSFVVLVRDRPGHGVLLDHLSDGNRRWVPRASAVILAATSTTLDHDFARYDVGQAAAHLTLQARALGLHAHQFAGYDRGAVAAGLGVPEGFELMAAIAVGRRGGDDVAEASELEREAKPRQRRPLAEIVHRGRWGTAWEG